MDNVNQNTAKQFEQGQVDLGNFLGIRAYKSEKDGASDPYWIMPNNKGIIFEDYTDTKETTKRIPKKKVEQANGHEEHIKYNHPEYKNVIFSTILCSNITELEKSACPHVRGAFFLSINDFREFANEAISFLKDLWENYADESIVWREQSFQKCIDKNFTPSKIIERLTKTKLKDLDSNN